MKISTSLYENCDNYLQDTSLGRQVELALDPQKLILVERQGLRRKARRNFKVATKQLIKKCPIPSKGLLEVLGCLDPRERKRA